MQDLAFAIPGVDEAMGFAEIMKFAIGVPTNILAYVAETGWFTRHVKSMQYSVIGQHLYLNPGTRGRILTNNRGGP
jgi:hypothetical protein